MPSIFPWTMDIDMEKSNMKTLFDDDITAPDNYQTNPESFGDFEINVKNSIHIGTHNVCDPMSLSIPSTSFGIESKINCDEEKGTMSLSVGSKVEAKDFGDVWFTAEIIEVDYEEMEVLVCYDDTKKLDEWININSPRLRPLALKPKPPLTPTPSSTQDCSYEMPSDKTQAKFHIGERCLAKWNNNGKFTATIQRELDNDQYEVMFDDGVLWTCKVTRLYKLKSSGSETPNSSSASPANISASPPKIFYNRHLFDPTKDYLCSKSERREKKRKLNIKALFNIGQKKTLSCSRKTKHKEKNVYEAVSDVAMPMEDEEPEAKVIKSSPEPPLESFEQDDDDEDEQTISKMKEVIAKLECSIKKDDSETDSVASPTAEEIQEEIKIKKEKFDDDLEPDVDLKPVKEEVDSEPIKLVISLPKENLNRNRLNKIKKAKRLRLLREKKVKKEMEEVQSELEEMRRKVQEMKQEVIIKKERYSHVEPAKESVLLPGEWCCKWVNNQPIGIIYECEKIDKAKTIQRLAVQVEDKRIPLGWIKLLVRRSIGSSAGKWDVSFVSPDNRKIHTKCEMKAYLENNPNVNLKQYEAALLDFGIHRKLSRRLGWDDDSPIVPAIAHKPKKKKIDKHDKIKKSTKKKPKLCAIPITIEADNASTVSESSTFVPPAFDNSTWEEGYVYVGSLKTQVINNMLRCPAEGCFKNFRTNILLQMHIKYYHKELTALMGTTPNVIDLAYARTAPESEVELKPKIKTPKQKRLEAEPYSEPPQRDMGAFTADFDKLQSSDSPKLRKALVAKRKRPRVLLPVRKVESAESKCDETATDFTFKDELEKKFGSTTESVNELDFESEISVHTVNKIGIDKKSTKGGVSAVSEEDDIGSDTMSSYPHSSSPLLDVAHGPMQRSKEGELYYTSETGEKIKIVHMKREEIINCHCGFREEDGLMIQCELCLCWQHALCHNIQKESEVPEKYTCSICLNPRRGRRSRRFVHDQDRLYEGLLPGDVPCHSLRRAHELSGNLLRIEDALHALRVQRYVAAKRYHPKLYLWAADWESPDMTDKYTDFDLSTMITNINKANLPLSDGITEDDVKGLSQRSDGSNSLSNLLGSPSGFDLPITTSEIENLAKSVQEAETVRAPQPEAAIQDSTCKQRLLVHVQRCQALIDARLDSIEAQVAELESQDPSLVDDETADYFPRTKQTIQMLLRDLDTMEELGVIT